jgi:hypothetical protein
MLLVFAIIFMLAFSIYLSIEAMKFGLCEKRWFVAAMCLGPVALPMFNVKRNLALHKEKRQGEVRGYF